MIRSKIFVTFFFSLFLFIFLFLFTKFNFYKRLELGIIDFLFKQREVYLGFDNYNSGYNPYVSDKAKVIGIDSTSLEKIGKWPWHRYVHANYLNNIQRFNPKTVLLDIFFVLEEKMPKTLEKIINEKPEVSNVIKEAFYLSDKELANSFKKYDNIFIDLFLLPKAKRFYDENIIQNIKEIEKKVVRKSAVSFPTHFQQKKVRFYESLEPIVKQYLPHVHIGPVNVEKDHDLILRHSLLLHPYLTQEKEKVYFLSALLQIVLKYYDIDNKNLVFDQKGIHFYDATVPEIDKYGQTVERLVLLKDIKQKLIKQNNNFKIKNQNLYHFTLNEYGHLHSKDDSEKVPSLPIKILQLKNGKYKYINGYEIYQAALKTKAKYLKVVFCKKQNIFIPTTSLVDKEKDGSDYNMPINYPGRDFFKTEENKFNRRLPTESYHQIYLEPKLPSIPRFLNRLNPTQEKEIYQWFYDYIFFKANEIKYTSYKNDKKVDLASVAKVILSQDIFAARFYFFYLYFKDKKIKNNMEININSKEYLRFLKNIKKKYQLAIDDIFFEDENFWLSHKSIIRIFLEKYEVGYKKFYDKHIFTGAIAKGMAKDIYQTPYDENFGINIITSAFNTIVTQQFLYPIKGSSKILILLFCCLFFSFIYNYVSSRIRYFMFVILLIVIMVVSYVCFLNYNLILNTGGILLSNFLSFFVILTYQLIVEEKDKHFLKETFSSYLSKDVIDQMYHSKEMPKLGGEEKKITAYFTDIKGFSSFSEILTPTELVLLLNEYLTSMTNVLFKYKGTLDKYQGDAIIAFFGAPVNMSNSPYISCLSSLEMLKELAKLRKKWSKEKDKEYTKIKHKNLKLYNKPDDKWPSLVHKMGMRIGLNFSNMLIGNMGSESRMNYTMMGDGVNLAARLEAIGKQYGVSIVASESIFNATWENEENNQTQYVKDYILFRRLDKVIVVGKTLPVDIYEVVTIKEKATKKEIEKCEVFEKGLQFYFNMEWDNAILYFQESKKLETSLEKNALNPSHVFLERCQQFKENPPKLTRAKKWDGVFRATNK